MLGIWRISLYSSCYSIYLQTAMESFPAIYAVLRALISGATAAFSANQPEQGFVDDRPASAALYCVSMETVNVWIKRIERAANKIIGVFRHHARENALH